MSDTERQAKEIFWSAVDHEGDVEAFIEEACGDKSEIRVRVEELLNAHRAAGDFLRNPNIDATIDSDRAPKLDATEPGRPEPTVSSFIGPYKLLEEIGEGGMGTVWVAQQSKPIKRKVAIKLIKAGMDSKSVLARFEAERQALALMDHPNIARVIDAGMTEQGRPYFAMEYVKGVPLTEYCDQAKLSVKERLELFLSICNAVQHAHQKGIVHRDLKPTNILICLYDGKPVPKVIDFGLAKALNQSLTDQSLYTAHGMMIGTPLYMSPEQAEHNNLDIDTRTDVYSLGVILYELLTGTTPLEKAEMKQAAVNEMMRLIKEVEPPKPSTRLSGSASLPSVAAQRSIEPANLTRSLTGDLDWVVMKALEKERTRRYDTANGFALDIMRHLNDEPVSASPPSTKYRIRKFIKRNRAGVMAAVSIAGVLLLGVVGTTSGMFWALSQKEIANEAAIRATKAEEQTAESLKEVAAERDAKELALEDAKTKKAESEKQQLRAENEQRIAQAVKDFLQNKLLAQADATFQADSLLAAGGEASETKWNPTIRELLDRAAEELSSDKIEQSFPNQPLAQAEILATVGRTYRGIGKLTPAIDFLKRAEALYKKCLGPGHPKTLVTTNSLAMAYLDTGKLGMGQSLYAETLKLSNSKFGQDHPVTLSSMEGLAEAYQHAGKLDLAIPLYEKTLELAKTNLGHDHPSTLLTLNNLAVAYQFAHKMDLALPLLEESRKLTEARYGPEHPSTIASMNNVGQAYKVVGNLDLAIPLLEATLNLQKAKVGLNKADTFVCMHNLGGAYMDAGKLDLALPLYEESLKLSKINLGHDHPVTIQTMNSLASAYGDAEKMDLALPLCLESLKLSKNRLGHDHYNTLTTMNNLALLYKDAGKLDLAIPLLTEALKLSKNKSGRNETGSLAIMDNLARVYQTAGKLDLALPLFEETAKLKKEKFGADHPDTLKTMGKLANTYMDVGKLDLALPLLEETLKLKKAKLRPNHPDTLKTMGNLAAAYLASGKLNLALPLFEETLKLQEAELGPNHPSIVVSKNNLAAAYQNAGKLDLALPLFEELLPIQKAKLGLDHPHTLSAMHNLGVAYLSLEKVDQALPLLEEALRLQKAKFGPNHGNTLVFMSSLGKAYLSARKLDLALPLCEESVKLAKIKFGKDHFYTIWMMGNLAGVYQSAGKSDLALPLFVETLKLAKIKLGKDHPNTLTTMNNVAEAYRKVGNLDQALAVYQDSLQLHKVKFGPDHSDTIQTQVNLGRSYTEAGRHTESIPLLLEAFQASKKPASQRAALAPLLDAYVKAGETTKFTDMLEKLLADARKSQPKSSPQLAGELAQFGMILLEQKKWAEAEPLLRECLAIREKALPDNWLTSNTSSMLGGSLLGQKKYEEAEPLLLAGYEGMQERETAIPPQAKIRLNEALKRLVELYEANDNPDKAAQWQTEYDQRQAEDDSQ